MVRKLITRECLRSIKTLVNQTMFLRMNHSTGFLSSLHCQRNLANLLFLHNTWVHQLISNHHSAQTLSFQLRRLHCSRLEPQPHQPILTSQDKVFSCQLPISWKETSTMLVTCSEDSVRDTVTHHQQPMVLSTGDRLQILLQRWWFPSSQTLTMMPDSVTLAPPSVSEHRAWLGCPTPNSSHQTTSASLGPIFTRTCPPVTSSPPLQLPLWPLFLLLCSEFLQISSELLNQS